MHKTSKISGLLAALLLAWGQADAAGLGRLSVQSALGQPLKAEIELYSVTKEEMQSISARLASVDAFRQARIERLDALNSLRFSVDTRPNGQPIIRVSSSAPITDPFLDLLIELNWPSGRLLREYTLLLDPPAEAKPAPVERAAPTPTTAPTVSKPAAAEKAAEVTKPAVKEEAKPAKAEKPAVKEYGPVKKGETLRSIAGKLKPEAATIEQMMVGLYQANKESFLDGNMNRLKKGEVLKVPELENLMLAASPSHARQMVQQQAAEWHAARAQAQAREAAPEPAKDKAAATGKIEAAKPAAPVAAPAPAKDVLKLSKGEPVTAGKVDAKTTERLHALEEDLAAKSRALKEAQDRVAQLEKTVQDLQRLIELKAQQPVAAPVPDAKPAEPQPPTPAVEAAKPAAPAPAPEAKPEPKPEPGLIDTLLANPLYLGGGLAGVLLLALLGISIARRRRQQNKPGDLASLNTGLFGATAGPAAAATAVPTAARAESSVLTDFSRLGLGAIDTQEIDPIAEAEVYLAYGKDAQAEEILRDALSKNPGREDILLKLLEIYHGRKDTATFETTARDLQSALGGDTAAPSWTKAAGMGREIDPANPLYAVAAVAAAASVLDMEMPAAEAAVEMPAAEPVSEPAPSVLPPGLDFEFTMTPPAAEAEPGPFDAMPSLDFSAELAQAPEAVEATEPEQVAEPDMLQALEAMPGMPAEPEAIPVEALAEAPAPSVASEMTLPDLDFGDLNLELGESAPPAAEEPAAAAPEAAPSALPNLDFGGLDLALESAEPAAELAPAAQVEPQTQAEPALEMPAPAAAEPAAEMELPDLDFGNLNLSEAEASVAAEPEPVAETPAEAQDELWAEVNTKLDLARAYIEMGDKEGAREILQEVLAEGNSQQAAEANKLLSEAV
ncbi:pilus assembly protein FimV [Sulfuritortus calidifontis]|uniref:Pilus assembly protein FimV n=1 Tax=Sulfuritortus calidifontis TaxID=1914471 RepID=A0A4R3JWZ6_9PROT|nr:FimV/HubP family polar landmark protein [Sulfuritortus calidifontis]TCS72943.1 pilus assembly protein FimV [Sulfuritortus calidifontis]